MDRERQGEKPARFALFDLDHTLLPHDTQLLFCNFVMRQEGEGWRRILLLPFLLAAPLVLLKLVDLKFLKRVFLGYLRGLSRGQLEVYTRLFADEVVESELHPEVMAEVERHRAEGRTLVLNSASPEFYVTVIGERLGFDAAYGTRVEVSEVMPFMPRIEGRNNKGGAKLDRMKDLLPDFSEERPLAGSDAYSDSSADLPMLGIVEQARVVDASARLREIAREKGWEEIEVARHRDHGSMLRQLLGIYRG